MLEPFYNTQQNLHLFKKLASENKEYCYYCNRPLSYKLPYCSSCSHKIITKGLEYSRVSMTDIGLDTINYQQHLHTTFFGCNAPYKFRGKKEDRIKLALNKDTILKAEANLRNLYSKDYYYYNSKKYNRDKQFNKLVVDVADIRNLYLRMLYNLLLIQISYHIHNSNLFATEVHYQATITYHPVSHMYRHRYKQYKIRDYKPSIDSKYTYYQLEKLEGILKPLLIEVIESIY